jgi:[citrate (pro-3S)-lyase] ligase
MGYEQDVKRVNLKNPYYLKKWENLLQKVDIQVSTEVSIDDITCVGVFEADQLIATGSFQENILKYIAVDPTYHDGKLFNLIISTLISTLAQQQIFHIFVFTKPIYQMSFEFVGFKTLVKTDVGVLLETGDTAITDYLATIPRIANQKNCKISAIVMNANPFTLGHRYLVEEASKSSDLVYIFVVKQDVSLFKTTERFHLVQVGVSDLSNVRVVSGDEYMVSYATFPTYFIPDKTNIIRYQTEMDATLFKQKIAKPLHIKTRYLGEEPFSKTTEVYNETLKRILPPEVQVEIIPRLKINTQIISATKVRKAIQQNQIETIKDFLPNSTYNYIRDHLKILQNSIKEGMNIDGN